MFCSSTLRIRATFPVAVLSLALVFAAAGVARADKLLFSGTHAIKFSHNGVIKEVSESGTGVAGANGSSGPLSTLQLTRPFAKITATTMGTDPGTGIDEIGIEAVRINPALAGPGGNPGIFAPIRSAVKGTVPELTRSTLPGAGTIRICNLTGCPASVALKLTQTMSGLAIGPGVGGTIQATGMSGTVVGVTMVTAVGQPWTVNTAVVQYETENGGTGTFTEMGFAHGPLGMTGTTLDVTSMGMGGVLQLVSAIQTTCSGCNGTNDPIGQITRLTINFAPEPGLFALLGAGAAGLVLLGRTRVQP